MSQPPTATHHRRRHQLGQFVSTSDAPLHTPLSLLPHATSRMHRHMHMSCSTRVLLSVHVWWGQRARPHLVFLTFEPVVAGDGEQLVATARAWCARTVGHRRTRRLQRAPVAPRALCPRSSSSSSFRCSSPRTVRASSVLQHLRYTAARLHGSCRCRPRWAAAGGCIPKVWERIGAMVDWS
jgi:hypothetical protein